MNTQGDLQHASFISNWHAESETDSPAKPNIFDILSHDNMQSLLHPAFKHFFKWLTSQLAVLRRFQRFGDEVYLVVHSAIELMYMKTYNSMLAEHFYGMKREPMIKTRSKRVFTTLFSILVPYFKLKMDHFYEELEKNIEGQQNDLSETADFKANKLKYVKTRIKKFLLKYYPYFHLVWVSAFWYYRIAYIGNSTQYHSPVLAILGQKLVYDMPEEDGQYGVHTLRTNFLRTMLYFGNHAFTWALYFLQMFKWSQDREENGQQDDILVGELPNPKEVAETVVGIYTGESRKKGEYYDDDLEMNIPPPPKLPESFKETKYYKILTERPGMCPLCSRQRTNECTLAVSGFVFCYPCVFRFVKENKCCPVTGCPCSTKSIIRLYPSTIENA
jgi:peroxin-12